MDINRHIDIIVMRCKPLIKEQKPFMAWAFEGGHGVVLTGAVEQCMLLDPGFVRRDAKPLGKGAMEKNRSRLNKILKDHWRAVTMEWSPETGLVVAGDPMLCEELKARLSVLGRTVEELFSEEAYTPSEPTLPVEERLSRLEAVLLDRRLS